MEEGGVEQFLLQKAGVGWLCWSALGGVQVRIFSTSGEDLYGFQFPPVTTEWWTFLAINNTMSQLSERMRQKFGFLAAFDYPGWERSSQIFIPIKIS